MPLCYALVLSPYALVGTHTAGAIAVNAVERPCATIAKSGSFAYIATQPVSIKALGVDYFSSGGGAHAETNRGHTYGSNNSNCLFHCLNLVGCWSSFAAKCHTCGYFTAPTRLLYLFCYIVSIVFYIIFVFLLHIGTFIVHLSQKSRQRSYKCFPRMPISYPPPRYETQAIPFGRAINVQIWQPTEAPLVKAMGGMVGRSANQSSCKSARMLAKKFTFSSSLAGVFMSSS